MKEIVIIGNGIAGITAARHIRKGSDFRIIVISSETDFFFSRTAMMYVFMGQMKFEHTKPYEDSFWLKNKIELIRGRVNKIDYKSKQIFLNDSINQSYDSLIIATGSNNRTIDFEGSNLSGIQTLYSYQDLQLLEQNCSDVHQAAIVGGGLIGIEVAEMLRSRNIAVTQIIREDGYYRNVLPKEESKLVERQIQEHGVDLVSDSNLKKALGDQSGRIKSITTNNREIDCQLLVLSIGVIPNVDFLKESDLSINQGILVNEFLQTNQEGVFAIGDCAEIEEPFAGRNSIETSWYTGRIMGETVAQSITGKKSIYNPGNWFNSAKFFDLEYQTYGKVDPNPENSFYWESDGKALRFQFDEPSQKLLGVNALGVRLRHEVFDDWLTNEVSMKFVINHLDESLFDPEFDKSVHSDILEAYKNIHVKL